MLTPDVASVMVHVHVRVLPCVTGSGVHACVIAGAVVSNVTVRVSVPVEFVLPSVSFAVALM